MVSIHAGNGVHGSTDGVCATAAFNWPFDLKFDPKDDDCSLFIADFSSNKIRKISQGKFVSVFVVCLTLTLLLTLFSF